jgi:hypothetical protein
MHWNAQISGWWVFPNLAPENFYVLIFEIFCYTVKNQHTIVKIYFEMDRFLKKLSNSFILFARYKLWSLTYCSIDMHHGPNVVLYVHH